MTYKKSADYEKIERFKKTGEQNAKQDVRPEFCDDADADADDAGNAAEQRDNKGEPEPERAEPNAEPNDEPDDEPIRAESDDAESNAEPIRSEPNAEPICAEPTGKRLAQGFRQDGANRDERNEGRAGLRLHRRLGDDEVACVPERRNEEREHGRGGAETEF